MPADSDPVHAYAQSIEVRDLPGTVNTWFSLRDTARYQLDEVHGAPYYTVETGAGSADRMVRKAPFPWVQDGYNGVVEDVVGLEILSSIVATDASIPAGWNREELLDRVKQYSLPSDTEVSHPERVQEALDEARKTKQMIRELLDDQYRAWGTVSTTVYEHRDTRYVIDEGEDLPPGWEPELRRINSERDQFSLDELVKQYNFIRTQPVADDHPEIARRDDIDRLKQKVEALYKVDRDERGDLFLDPGDHPGDSHGVRFVWSEDRFEELAAQEVEQLYESHARSAPSDRLRVDPTTPFDR